MKARAAVAGTIIVASLALVSGARAFWGNGAQIVSASDARHEQADDNTQLAAISEDGRYVAFQTRARNFFADDDPDPPGQFRRGGIFRRDLATGALELVAYGDLVASNGTLVTRGAQNPSISADGRFVAFSTAWKLTPADTNPNVDVYVRDMTLPVTDPGAYELISAHDGGDLPAAYTGTVGTVGSEVSRYTAISADGTKVLFRTTTASDLSGPNTPAQQLYLRDRAAKTTQLITRKLADGSPAGGARDGILSADGTTVLFTASKAFDQTPSLAGEVSDPNRFYYLWQRAADGPTAPTRRITGAVDLDDPACAPDTIVIPNPTQTGPCYGPLVNSESTTQANISGKVPTLSADGWTVAFVTAPSLRPVDQGQHLDLFLTDMHDGVSRKAGTVELTREGTDPGDASAGSDIEDAAMSADGNRIAFTTVRTRFVLPSPRLVGDPAVSADVSELYVLDLPTMEIERVTRGYDGSESNGSTSSAISISRDGRSVAFVSSANNLYQGDAQAQDAFVATEQVGPTAAQLAEPLFDQPPDSGANAPGPAAAKPRLRVRLARAGKGVRLVLRVPGPGKVSAIARSRVRPAGKRRLLTIARDAARVLRKGRATLVLQPSRRYLRGLGRHGRLRARVEITFVSPGGGALKATRAVSFTR